MDLQFVFGNPIRKGSKKPLPKSKGHGKVVKATKKEKSAMATKKRRKTHSRKNPTLYGKLTGKKNKAGQDMYTPLSIPVPVNDAEYRAIQDMAKNAGKLGLDRELSETEMRKAIEAAKSMGIESPKITKYEQLIASGDFEHNYDEIANGLQQLGVVSRAALLKKYAADLKKNAKNIQSSLQAAVRSGNTLKPFKYQLDDMEYVNEPDDVPAYTKVGIPGTFYKALANHYSHRKDTSTVSKRKKRNPTVDFAGLEDELRSNPSKKRKKRKSVKAVGHAKPKRRKKTTSHPKKARRSTKTVKRRKSSKMPWFTVVATPKKKSKAAYRKAFKMVGKKRKGSKAIVSYKGYKLRRNPDLAGVLSNEIAMGEFNFKSLVRPIAVLAGAAAFSGATNGLIKYGVSKIPMLQKLASSPIGAIVMPSAGPLVFAGLLAAASKSKFGYKHKALLVEASIALATVGIVTLGINAFGGVVSNMLKKVFPTALAGHDGSLGLIPEGMSADVDMGDECGDVDGADFGDDMSGADFGDDMSGADFGGVANFSGVSNFQGDDVGEDMGDADFGDVDGADFGDIDGVNFGASIG